MHKGDRMAKTQTDKKKKVDAGLQVPRSYNVVFFNDNVTPMDFVVSVLRSVFRKQEDDAQALMLKVHNEGSAVAGTYPLDIAASKTNKVMRMAKQQNHPLKVTVEHAE